MSKVAVTGNIDGTGTFTIAAPNTNADSTLTLPVNSGTLGFAGVPLSGSAKTGSYTLAVSDVGQLIEVGSGGSITIPDATFATGDIVSIFNNTSGSITITCTITTAYISGIDADTASASLLTRGVCSVLFISGTVCVLTGSVTT
jgi:spore coat protein U-like protein